MSLNKNNPLCLANGFRVTVLICRPGSETPWARAEAKLYLTSHWRSKEISSCPLALDPGAPHRAGGGGAGPARRQDLCWALGRQQQPSLRLRCGNTAYGEQLPACGASPLHAWVFADGHQPTAAAAVANTPCVSQVPGRSLLAEAFPEVGKSRRFPFHLWCFPFFYLFIILLSISVWFFFPPLLSPFQQPMLYSLWFEARPSIIIFLSPSQAGSHISSSPLSTAKLLFKSLMLLLEVLGHRCLCGSVEAQPQADHSLFHCWKSLLFNLQPRSPATRENPRDQEKPCMTEIKRASPLTAAFKSSVR